MQLGEEGLGLLRLARGEELVVVGVQVLEFLAREIERIRSRDEGEETLLHKAVVEHSRLAVLGLVLVRELLPDRSVADRNGARARERSRRVGSNADAEVRHAAVHEGGRAAALVLARLGVDVLEAGEHVNVGDADMVEQHKAVVHGTGR